MQSTRSSPSKGRNAQGHFRNESRHGRQRQPSVATTLAFPISAKSPSPLQAYLTEISANYTRGMAIKVIAALAKNAGSFKNRSNILLSLCRRLAIPILLRVACLLLQSQHKRRCNMCALKSRQEWQRDDSEATVECAIYFSKPQQFPSFANPTLVSASGLRSFET